VAAKKKTKKEMFKKQAQKDERGQYENETIDDGVDRIWQEMT